MSDRRVQDMQAVLNEKDKIIQELKQKLVSEDLLLFKYRIKTKNLNKLQIC